MTTLADRLLERFQALPADAQAEVVDFVEFLLTRRQSMIEDWSKADQNILAQLAATGDDPVAYDERDLRERWA